MKKFLISLAIVLGMSAMSVKAQSVSYAKSLIQQGRYLDAAKQLRPLADGGNAEAQYLAATLFFDGKGVSKSEEQGIKYATMAANQGYKDAMMLMIEHYFRTNNFVKAYKTCKEYISKHPYLMTSQVGFGLGLCYMEGWGVAKDEERGWEIITKVDDKKLIQEAQDHYSKQWDAYIERHPELNKERMPSFPGGASKLASYLSNEVEYPYEAYNQKIQGRVIVTFVVERDGSISDAQVVQSVYPSLDEEALRVVNNMPKWIPGMQKGKTLRVKYTVPITFRLTNNN